MSRFLLVIAAALAIAATATGCGGDEAGDPGPSAKQIREGLAGSPPALARVHAQAGEMLGGGADAFEERLRALKGHPVVVNKWASWCGPCREELPYFQRQAVEHGSEIAFLGVASDSPESDAREFLEQYPTTYPSYEDPTLAVAGVFEGELSFPATAFYDSKGELAFLRQGAYLEEQDLVEDIRRYAR